MQLVAAGVKSVKQGLGESEKENDVCRSRRRGGGGIGLDRVGGCVSRAELAETTMRGREGKTGGWVRAVEVEIERADPLQRNGPASQPASQPTNQVQAANVRQGRRQK